MTEGLSSQLYTPLNPKSMPLPTDRKLQMSRGQSVSTNVTSVLKATVSRYSGRKEKGMNGNIHRKGEKINKTLKNYRNEKLKTKSNDWPLIPTSIALKESVFQTGYFLGQLYSGYEAHVQQSSRKSNFLKVGR